MAVMAAWTADADRKRAWHIATGRGKTVLLSVQAVARILHGEDPEQVLAGEFGPQTLAVLREIQVVSTDG